MVHQQVRFTKLFPSAQGFGESVTTVLCCIAEKGGWVIVSTGVASRVGRLGQRISEVKQKEFAVFSIRVHG